MKFKEYIEKNNISKEETTIDLGNSCFNSLFNKENIDIDDFEGIEDFKNLLYLYINGQKLTDISFLKDLKKIKKFRYII